MENSSGIHPYDLKILVKPIKYEEKTEGGIILPETSHKKMNAASHKALLVEAGCNAFWEVKKDQYKPKVGQYVAIAAYAGYLITGKDGEQYRLINDTDITGILEDNTWDIQKF